MNANITGISDMLETASVLKSAKNFFFTVSLVCLLVLGAIFVLGRLGMVNYPWQASCDDNVACEKESGCAVPALAAVMETQEENQPQPEDAAEAEPQAELQVEVAVENDPQAAVEEMVQIQDAARKEAAAEPEVIEQQAEEAVAAVESEQEQSGDDPADETAEDQQVNGYDAQQDTKGTSWQLCWRTASALIRLCNAVLVFSLTFYCLTLLIALKVTLIGRLGAAYYITSAFFFALFAAVIFMPWQSAFPGVGLAGAMYLPYELACATINYDKLSRIGAAMFYLRFFGLWALVLLSLIMAQGRSMCWAGRAVETSPNV